MDPNNVGVMISQCLPLYRLDDIAPSMYAMAFPSRTAVRDFLNGCFSTNAMFNVDTGIGFAIDMVTAHDLVVVTYASDWVTGAGKLTAAMDEQTTLVPTLIVLNDDPDATLHCNTHAANSHHFRVMPLALTPDTDIEEDTEEEDEESEDEEEEEDEEGECPIGYADDY